jgi:hypothetical protein
MAQHLVYQSYFLFYLHQHPMFVGLDLLTKDSGKYDQFFLVVALNFILTIE